MSRQVKGMKPSISELKKLYLKESRSIREVAKILGCSKDMVYRSLRENEINLREGYIKIKYCNCVALEELCKLIKPKKRNEVYED